jgi:hypothetical protein
VVSFAQVPVVAGVAVCPVAMVVPVREGGWSVPKYVVTGGEDGQSGVNFAGKRYEPGDVVDVAKPKGLWLIDEGYLALASKSAKNSNAEEAE